jgi:hypothetical protein
MGFYTFLVTRGDAGPEAEHSSLQDCADHEEAKAHARQLLAMGGVGVATARVAIARGVGEEVEWLGAYDWERGSGEPVWSPDD